MQLATYVAIVAATISFISLTVAIISCVIAAKNYKKSKRLEFFQRRDQLFLKISDLNAKYSEIHLISARYGIVILKKMALRVEGAAAEENKEQIASIKRLLEHMELGENHLNKNIEQIHFLCSSLTPRTGAAHIERLIAMIQVALDDAKKHNEVSLASLHTLEGNLPILKASLAKMDELKKQLSKLDLEKAIREITRNEKAPD